MRERALAFGPQRGLVGVLTEPDAPRANAPTFLFPNVGVHHHAGPYRCYVDLARQLAELGLSTLRFDISGLGDSEPRSEPRDELQRAVADLRDAMTALSARGASRFALLGFCSGTDPTHALLREDDRVTAAVFLDGYAYRTPLWYAHRLPRYAKVQTWRAAVDRRLERYFGNVPREESVYSRDYPTRERCEADLLAATKRGAKLLFVFTGGAQLAFNHAGQLLEMFPALRGQPVEEVFQAGADHLFSTLAERRRLFDAIAGWAERSFR